MHFARPSCLYFTYCKLIPCSRIFVEKPIFSQLVKKFCEFYGIRNFIAVFITDCHWTLQWIKLIQSTTSHPVYLKWIIRHLRLCLLSDFFLSGFLTEVFYALVMPLICFACHIHLILLDLITLIVSGGKYKLPSSSLMQFPSASSCFLLRKLNIMSEIMPSYAD
jgi:hypothetical protein